MKMLRKLPIIVFIIISIFVVGCSQNEGKGDNQGTPIKNGLELLSFKVVQNNTTKKFANKSASYDALVEPDNQYIYLEAVIKNDYRDSFIDMVLHISFLDTYVVYNEGNGEYTCSSTTVYEEEQWVTKINLKVNLNDCKDLYGEVSVSEINFLHNGSTNQQVDLNKTNKNSITFHKHLYNKEIVSDNYLVTEADHYNKAKYYYSCECGKAGLEHFEVGELIQHNHNQKIELPQYLKEAANCIHGDIYYYVCECGHVGEETYVTNEAKHILTDIIYNEDETETSCGTVIYGCSLCDYAVTKEVEGTGGTPTLIYENIDSETCKVIGVSDKSTRTKIVIPEYFNGKQVVSIESYAFYNLTSIKNVIISNGVISIGDFAFQDCQNLEIMVIPNSVTSIGVGAFYGCSNLEFNINNNAKYLGNDLNPYLVLFSIIDASIEDYIISNNTKFIYSSAFEYCKNLISIEIPNSVTSIGWSAFATCDKLTNIEIPNSVTSIGNSAFYNCSSLASIVIPDSVTSIGNGTFHGCSSLESIEIPNSVTSIGSSAFSECTNLESIEIPDSVTNIDSYAFYGCSSLTIYCEATQQPSGWYSSWNPDNRPVYWGINETNVYEENGIQYILNTETKEATILRYVGNDVNIVINETVIVNDIEYSVISIGYGAFSGCGNLENVYYNGTLEDWCKIEFNNEYSNPMSYAEHFYMLDSNNEYYEVTELEIPNTVTSIGSYQFYSFDNILKIVIPDSVTSIGYEAFSWCWCSIIYCEATEQPSGWNSQWHSFNRAVYWGYEKQ